MFNRECTFGCNMRSTHDDIVTFHDGCMAYDIAVHLNKENL